MKWSNLEAEVKNWMTGNGHARISLSTKMSFCEVRRWAVACCAIDCGWTVCWCYRFMKRCALSMGSETTVAQNIPAEYRKGFSTSEVHDCC
jgi:hypothetical protein